MHYQLINLKYNLENLQTTVYKEQVCNARGGFQDSNQPPW